MAVSCEAALRMLRERARQFVSNAIAACVASANDSLFELTKAAPDAATQTRYLDAMRLWHGARRSLADALVARQGGTLGRSLKGETSLNLDGFCSKRGALSGGQKRLPRSALRMVSGLLP